MRAAIFASLLLFIVVSGAFAQATLRVGDPVQLTISGCVGPCDVPNVVVITSSASEAWLGNIVKFDQYRSLLEWAVRCRDAGEMLSLPREFLECRMSPFCS